MRIVSDQTRMRLKLNTHIRNGVPYLNIIETIVVCKKQSLTRLIRKNNDDEHRPVTNDLDKIWGR